MGIADSLDCNPCFNGSIVSVPAMPVIMLVSIPVLGGIYLLMTAVCGKRR
ncbi:MAG: hypothetical protein Q4C42_07510 [Clostridia bacterium]|nr:hypothetical protein [Clostridia bacterium]